MHEFDRPFFKRLATNDTGAGKGKQGGVFIPRDLDDFFPRIALPTPMDPAPGIPLKAALFDGTRQVGLSNTRYQYQSWGGNRRPERRLTAELGPILSKANKDDFLLVERSLSDPLFYRLTLHRAGTAGYGTMLAKTGTRRWGPVDPGEKPVPEREIEVSEEEQDAREVIPLQLFDNDAALHESRVKRIARNRAFSRRVLPLYDYRCAVCGKGHAAENIWEVEAAHIVPRGLKGADHARNGLALCRSHHWAFDSGLFGIDADLKVVIRLDAAADPRNAHLLPFQGMTISDPSDTSMRPDPRALAWHLKNVVRR